jgi:hypothetical protein
MLTSISCVTALLAVLRRCSASQFPLTSEYAPPIALVPSEDWHTLNQSVGGRLFAGLPVGLPCYDNFNGNPKLLDKKACDVVEANKSNMTFLTTQMGGYTQVLL